MIRLLAVNTSQTAASAPTEKAAAAPSTAALVTAYLVALIGFVVAVVLSRSIQPAAFTPADGFSALALLYIVTQAIERGIEPFTGLVKSDSEVGGSKQSKNQAMAGRANALAEAYAEASRAGGDTKSKVMTAADWHKAVEEVRANTSVYAWGFATALGALASGALGLYLMRAVGAAAVPTELDILVTGLIAGGGSKAVHDLIKNIEKAKEKKEDPPEVA